MYILVFQPVGKSKLPNLEVVNLLDAVTLQQAASGVLKVIKTNHGLSAKEDSAQELFYVGGGADQMSSFIWMPIKQLELDDQSDVGVRIRTSRSSYERDTDRR